MRGRLLGDRQWWEERWFFVAIGLLSAIPLLLPETPPLVDVPGHIGRYRVQLELLTSPTLQRFFDFDWRIVGNLGVDLLVIPLAPIMGLEPAVKLIVLTIPVLTTAGIFWTANEVHGRVPPTTLFAVPFAYGFSFNFGFINFALSMALALLALPLWLCLGRLGRTRLRIPLFVALSCILWIVHVFGWAVLCLTIWSVELVRNRDSGLSWMNSIIRGTAAAATVLALPLLLMLVWRGGAPNDLSHYSFNIFERARSLTAALRDRWLFWDTLGVGLALVLIGAALFNNRLEFSRKLALPAALLAVIWLLLPHKLFGSVFADTRLAPYILILTIVAIRFAASPEPVVVRRVATLGLLFVLLRLGGTTLSFAMADREMKARLAALDHIPNGARVLSLVGDSCASEWPMPRHWHVGSFVIMRRRGFSNDEWQVPGAQLLKVVYQDAGKFAADPTEVVYPAECLTDVPPRLRGLGHTAEQAIAEFPRSAFDYVWVVRAPDFDRRRSRQGLTPVWQGEDSVLYKVHPHER